MNDDLIERLKFLLHGRKKHPWGASITLSRGSVENLFKGEILNHLLMGTITRAENASLTWIVDGRGSPYVVHRVDSGEEGADYVRELIETEKDWSVHLVMDTGRPDNFLLILTQPGEYSYTLKEKSATLNYTITEIISGPLDEDVIQVIEENEKTVIRVELPHGIFEKLSTGWIGNYDLFGADGKDGLIAKYRRREVFKVRELIDEGQYFPGRGSKHRTEREIKLNHLFMSLDTDDQDIILRVAEALHSQKNNPMK